MPFYRLLSTLGLAVALLSASAFADERDVAEWVIRQGGRVVLTTQTSQPVSELAALPKSGPVFLHAVDLYGTIIEPKELERLSKLTQIRELYLPGPSWNPGAGSLLDANEELKFLSGLQTLEKLHFSLHFLTNVNVRDKGLKHLETLTGLKELRLAQGRIQKFSLAPFPLLEGLDLSYSTARDEVLQSLAQAKHLKRLNLRDTLITDDGLEFLSGITTLEEIDLYGLKITDRGLAHLQGLRNLRKLNLLGGPITDTGAETLAGFTELRDLNLYRAEITNAGLAKLASLRKLAFLDLRYTKATASGVEKLRAALPQCKIDFSGSVSTTAPSGSTPPAGSSEALISKWITSTLHGKVQMRDGHASAVSLARTPVNDAQMSLIGALTSLEELDLEATEIGDLGLAALSRLTSLRRLNLGSTTVSDRGLAHLAPLTRLEKLNLSATLVRNLGDLPGSLLDLDLSSSGVNADGFKQVAKLSRLQRLNLAYVDSSDDKTLALLQPLPALRALNLTGTDINDPSLELLAKMQTLEELQLNHGRFTEKGFAALAELKGLRRLEAVRTGLGPDSAATLAALPKLEYLNLDYTKANDAALAAIASLPLIELRLDSATITDAAVGSLSAMKTLKFLNLYHTLISEDAHAKLLKALPETRIVWDRDSKLPNRRGS